jgi:hypothetical protein
LHELFFVGEEWRARHERQDTHAQHDEDALRYHAGNKQSYNRIANSLYYMVQGATSPQKHMAAYHREGI